MNTVKTLTKKLHIFRFFFGVFFIPLCKTLFNAYKNVRQAYYNYMFIKWGYFSIIQIKNEHYAIRSKLFIGIYVVGKFLYETVRLLFHEEFTVEVVPK